MEARYHAPDIECDGCANSIKRALGRVAGIQSVEVDVAAKDVSVRFDAPASAHDVEEALDQAGFPVSVSPSA